MSDEEVTSKIFENMKKGFNIKDTEEKKETKDEDSFSVSNSLDKMLGKTKETKIILGKDKKQGMSSGALKTGIQKVDVKEDKVKHSIGNIDVSSSLDKMLGKKKK